MKLNYLFVVFFMAAVAVVSCSKKNHPSKQEATSTTTVTTVGGAVAKDTTMEKKAPVKTKAREAVPKVITVSDASAQKTVDGRYYYDLQGHRYWRNNKDGKYYLFNKTMYADAAFKPEQN
jgi:hypothetical protein